jgi:hypothetical protein
MGRAHVLPPLAIPVLPTPILASGDPVPAGEIIFDSMEKRQAIEKMAHGSFLIIRQVAVPEWSESAILRLARDRGAARLDGCRTTR